MANEKVRFAGEVKIVQATITTPAGMKQNITAQIAAISIYESLYSPFITGKIVVKDSLDLVNLLALNGQDYLDLEIETPSLDPATRIQATYLIHKMTEREILGDKNLVYTLHFVSIEALVNINKKISRAYNDEVSETVKQIMTDPIDGLETTKEVFTQRSISTHKHISNWWTPLENIQYLTSRAVNADGSPYVFFENRDGFFFVALESMYDADVYQEFVHDKYTRSPAGDGTKDVRDIGEDYKRITDLHIDTAYDFMSRIKSGMFGSRMITYDLFTKKYTVQDFNTSEEFEKLKNLNNNIGISKHGVARPVANQNTLVLASNTFTDYTDNNGDTSNREIYQKIKATKAMAKLNCVNITVPGRVDYSVGQKVQLKIPKMNPLSLEDEDFYDNRWSGYYLIAAINHTIDKQKHECSMELISDSLQMSVDAEQDDN